MLSNKEWLDALKKLPPLEQLRTDLTKLFFQDKSALSAQEIENLFLNASGFLPYNAEIYPSKTFNLLSLWRARINISEEKEDLTSFATFSYPDPKFCTENGRANLKEHPVFYCSYQGGTSFVETKPIAEDFVYLAKWAVRCKRDVSMMYFLPVNTPITNFFYKRAKQSFEKQLEFNLENGSDYAQHLNSIASFVSAAFVNEKKPYSLSSMLASKALGQVDNIDGIIYPSVVRSLTSCNLVFGTAFVDANLTLEMVYKLYISECNDNGLTYNLVEVGENREGAILWRQPNDEDDNAISKELS